MKSSIKSILQPGWKTIVLTVLVSAIGLLVAGRKWKNSAASTSTVISKLQATKRAFGGCDVTFVDPPVPNPFPTQALVVIRSQDRIRQFCPKDEFHPGDRCISLNWRGSVAGSIVSPLLSSLLRDLRVQESLTHLDLCYRRLPKSDAKSIMQMRALESLELTETGIDFDLLRQAAFSTTLKRLHIGGFRDQIHGDIKSQICVRPLEKFPFLEELSIYAATVSCGDSGEMPFAHPTWNSLHDLTLSNVDDTLSVLREYFDTADLGSLYLTNLRLDDPLADFLCSRRNLKHLTLRYVECDDSAVLKLADLAGLQRLDLLSNPIAPSIINKILQNPSIRELRCNVPEDKRSNVVWERTHHSVHFYSGKSPVP